MYAAFRVENRIDGICFELIADEPDRLLTSRRFDSLGEALRGLTELREHAGVRDRFRALQTAAGDCYFEFLDQDGQALATSRHFTSFKQLLQGEARLAIFHAAPLESDETG